MTFARLPSPKALISFESAARLLSFKDAANELSVTPGAVSQQIRGLEEALGSALFKREARTVMLTHSGELLKKSVSEGLQNIQETVNQITAQDQPTLQVNTNPSLVGKFLLPRINGFSDRFPNFDISIQTERGLTTLDQDGPDVVIRTTNAPPTDLHHHLLHRELLVPVASPDLIRDYGLVTPNDLVRAPLLHDASLSKFKGTPDWADWFKQAGLTCAIPAEKVRFEATAPEFLIDMAIAGNGVLLGRSSLIYNALLTGQLSCPFGPILQTNLGLYALCRQEKRAQPNVRAFMGWLREEAALLSTINALHSALQ